MADYRELLNRAVEALPKNTGSARRAIYEKARAALVGQLRAINPPLPSRDITTHRLELDECIRDVEHVWAPVPPSAKPSKARTRIDSPSEPPKPKAVSRRIKPLSPPVTAVAPVQTRRAPNFRVANGKILVARKQIIETLEIRPDQTQAYFALREEAESILRQGTNLLGDAERPVAALLDAMPNDMSKAQVFTMWRAGNRLRRLCAAHRAVVGQHDSHPYALDLSVAQLLEGLCDEFNNLAAVDPGLQQRDRWRASPHDVEIVDKQLDAIEPVIAEAIAVDAISPEAAAELTPQLGGSRGANGGEVYDALEKAAVSESRQNFVAALLKGALDVAKVIAAGGAKAVGHAARQMRDGFYSNVGKGVGLVILLLVVRNGPAIAEYASATFHSPQVDELISWLLSLFA